MIKALVAAVLLASATPAPPDHDITASLDPLSGQLSLEDQITVSGRNQLAFRLAPWIDVERITLDGARLTLAPDDGLWVVPLGDRQAHEIRVTLTGQVPGQGADFATPEGSFLAGDSGWFPDSGDRRITYRLSLQVPADQRIVANGRLVDEQIDPTSYRASFRADHPSEPPSIFAGPYQVRERWEGELRLRTYFHPELAELADEYLATAADLIARYDEAIGPYPYADFHIISAPIPVGLGFPNLTYVGRQVLPLPFMRGRSLAHEVLHNWWGNGVGIGPGGNWAEGLTTYLADYALSEAPRDLRLGWLRDYAALPGARDMAVSAFAAKRHDASQVIGYGKVAFIFHMLEQEIGQTAFSQGLQAFWRDHRFRAAGWAELQAAFEQASGRDLDWFFAQWLERTGAPRLELGEVAATEESLSITLRQDAPAYRLSVPLALTTAAGTTLQSVVIEDEETTIQLPLDQPLLSLHLDPEFDVFRRLLPGESPPILRDVTLAGETVTLIPSDDQEVQEIAAELARRLLDTPLRRGPVDPAAPLLVIGLSDDMVPVAERLDAAGSRPAQAGSAVAWTARLQGGQPALFVAADDAEALAQLLRPLPHYGAKSYVVFDGRRAIASGLWPTQDSPLIRQFSP